MTDSDTPELTAPPRGSDRRRFMTMAGMAGTAALLGACSSGDDAEPAGSASEGAAAPADDGSGSVDSSAETAGGAEAVDLTGGAGDLPEVNWEMATSWPAGLQTLFGTEDNGVGAVGFAQVVGNLSGGRFTIEAKQAGEIAGAVEIIDVLQAGAVPAGHTASYYYIGKSPVFAFGTAIPFGLTYRQQHAWLFSYRDDAGRRGLDVLREAYEPFGVINFPAGNTGCQMGGFFNSEINSLADLQGLVFRIPGQGGEIMSRLGATTQNLPAGEIAQALQTGALDAAEFVGPYDDNTLGLGEAAAFYYYPGFWEPGATLDVFASLDAYNDLPPEYQNILELAGELSHSRLMGYYDSIQPAALEQIAADGAEVRPFPDDVLQAGREESEALLEELAGQDESFAMVLEHWRPFRDAVRDWHGTAELSFMTASVA